MTRELTQRWVTAAVGIPLLLAILFLFDGILITPLLTVVAFCLLWEITGLAGWTSKLVKSLTGVCVCIVFLALVVYVPLIFETNTSLGLAVGFLGLLITLLGLYWVLQVKSEKEVANTRNPIGLVYWSLACIACLYFLNLVSVQYGSWLILAILLVCWGSDVAAYFVGKAFGKKLLAPRISPKKTVAGAVGGYVIGFLIALIVGLFAMQLQVSIAFWQVLVLALVVPALAIWGDFIESAFKRVVAAKDSSSLLPGHGGFLDRLDSVLPVPSFLVLILAIN